MAVIANRPQGEFLMMPQKFRAFVAGFGTGKSWVLCMAQAIHFQEHPRFTSGYFGPTYPHIRDIYYPTVEEAVHDFGFRVKINQGNHEVDFYKGRQYYGTSICRSMEHPGRIIGFKIAHAAIDELDTMPTKKAAESWRKIMARMRYKADGLRNGIDVGTTPEGFKFTYDQFCRQLNEKPDMRKSYGVVHASTYENAANLPADYIPSLLESYPSNLIAAYLNGKFVNLTAGTVYSSYDRSRNRSTETVKKGDHLRIGMDFNVGKMAAAVYVVRGGIWHAVDEIKNGVDTPSVSQTIIDRYDGHEITVYPDASGQNTSSKSASLSDLAILRQKGFHVLAKSTNPRIKDRVNAANRAFEKGLVMVNPTACPRLAECLEQHAYDDNGDPDKKGGHDHMTDAATYPIAYEMPINRPVAGFEVKFAV